jgi:hypothetical protein
MFGMSRTVWCGTSISSHQIASKEKPADAPSHLVGLAVASEPAVCRRKSAGKPSFVDLGWAVIQMAQPRVHLAQSQSGSY